MWNIQTVVKSRFFEHLSMFADTCGYLAAIHGSVAKFGESNHDLDVLFVPKYNKPQDAETLIKALCPYRSKRCTYFGDKLESWVYILDNGLVLHAEIRKQ